MIGAPPGKSYNPTHMHSQVRTRLALLFCSLWVIAGCSSAPPPPPVLAPASVDAVKKSIEYLASDELEGRGIGTAGLDTAANYVAGYFKGLGLRPLPGQTDYFQPFDFSVITGLGSGTKLQVDGKELARGEDFMPAVYSPEKAFEGPVVFVGYGLSKAKDLEGNTYDDFANVDVKGKVALALRFEPHDAKGQSRFIKGGWSSHAALERKATVAAEHGAVALLVVYPPNFHGAESLSPLGRRFGGTVPIPLIEVRQSVAESMLKQANAPDLKALQGQIDSAGKPASRVLANAAAKGQVLFQRNVYHLKNVCAMLEGKGKLKDWYIVIGAHYDHLGRGGFGSLAPGSREIHNGADDNASGTAGVLELARIFSHAGAMQRSLVFMAFSGEEQGLLGSQYWVEHPEVPLDHIEAMINLDMIGRAQKETLLVGGAGTSAPFDQLLAQADQGSVLKLNSSFRDGYAPSDNTSFVKKSIPVLFFWTGYHADYHRPTDKANKINYPDEARIIDLVAKVVEEIAYRSDVKFTAPAGPTTNPFTRPSGSGGGASLGVVPDYTESDTPGLRITGTSPNSPAQRAGLQEGDIITQIDARKIQTIYDLTDVLAEGQPGQTIRITVLRHGQSVNLEATLAARRGQQ